MTAFRSIELSRISWFRGDVLEERVESAHRWCVSHYSEEPYRRGTVGIATSGKDTGGSQFFVALSPQPHLEARYTVFGQVLEGMEIVDELVVGDIIEKIEIVEGQL